MKHMREIKTSSSHPVIQHRLVFTMSTAFHNKLVAAGINPDLFLLRKSPILPGQEL
jgi:hypothetical protein